MEYREITEEVKVDILNSMSVWNPNPFLTFEEYVNKWQPVSKAELTRESYEKSKEEHEKRTGSLYFFYLKELGDDGSFSIIRCFDDVSTLDQKYLVGNKRSVYYLKEK